MQSFINCFKIPELRTKILVTLGLIAIYRLGTFLTLPGVDVSALNQFFETLEDQEVGKFVNMVNMFSGGGLRNMTVFALGIMPYISASIIFQMLTTAVPALEKIKKEGPSGNRKISQWTRYATIVICIFQAFFIASYLQGNPLPGVEIVPASQAGFGFMLITVLTLTAGTAFLMWLGEQISAHGIGNGISMIIMASIISAAPAAISELAENFDTSGGQGVLGPDKLIVLLAIFVAVVFAVVAITRAQRRVPVQQAKVSRGRTSQGSRTYLPLKVNHAGVIPIIFAQALLMLPSMILQRFNAEGAASWFGPATFWYNVIYVALIVFFCFFYTAIIFNPKEMADNMKQNGSFIPGIRPGTATSDFLEFIMLRITYAGAIFFAMIAIMPLFMQGFNLSFTVTGFFGGTGLLIIVGVGMDVLEKVESKLMTHHYDGFVGNTSMKGRI